MDTLITETYQQLDLTKVPSSYPYIAIDATGDCYAYRKKPEHDSTVDAWDFLKEGSRGVFIGTTTPITYSKDTLRILSYKNKRLLRLGEKSDG